MRGMKNMASKKKSKKKSAPKKTVTRKCTICRKKGHNARTCGR